MMTALKTFRLWFTQPWKSNWSAIWRQSNCKTLPVTTSRCDALATTSSSAGLSNASSVTPACRSTGHREMNSLSSTASFSREKRFAFQELFPLKCWQCKFHRNRRFLRKSRQRPSDHRNQYRTLHPAPPPSLSGLSKPDARFLSPSYMTRPGRVVKTGKKMDLMQTANHVAHIKQKRTGWTVFIKRRLM